MLKRADIKDCLAGRPGPMVPAYFFWMDKQLIERHPEDISALRKHYEDDILFAHPRLIRRGSPPPLQSGEFADPWQCVFAASPQGVGSHPGRPIVRSVEDWEQYVEDCLPRMDREGTISSIKETAARNPEGYVLLNIWRTFYERMYFLIGMEELWMEIAEEGELFQRMMPVLRDFTLEAISTAGQGGADAVYLADDWGSQDRLQISPAAWRRHFKPVYGDLIAHAHGLGMDVWLHSCGNIIDIIPDWIELKLDVIGNLQPAALDLPAMAAAYKGQITFFGGLDVQHNVVKGTPDTIRKEVQELLSIFHEGRGRYIIGPSNTLMPETPIANVQALFESMDTLRRSAC